VIVDGVDEYPAPPKNKKKKPNEVEIPRWQRDKKLVRILSEQLSDGSDNDILEVTNLNHSPVKKTIRKERSRSRSPTPPPAVPIQEIQKARNLVRLWKRYLELPRPISWERMTQRTTLC